MASSSDESPLELTEGSQKFLDLFFAPSHTPLACLPVADAREAALRAVRQYGGPYLPVAHVEDVELATKDGCGCFHIRVYWSVLESEASGELPVLLYAHGGGWMRGSVDTTDQLCRRLVTAAQACVVSVDYRLSPENNYPAALDDLQSAWEWVLAHPRLSLERSAVGGDSAGGNLISALVVRLAAAKLPSPRLQVLIYPILDLTLRGASHRTFASGFGLCAASMRHFCSLYLGDGDGDDATLKKNPEVSPLFFGGLSALPPTLVISAEADPLVSEAGSFVRKLQGAGVEVGHVTYKGTVHAFLTYFEIFPEAAEAVEEIAGFLRKGWGLGLAAK